MVRWVWQNRLVSSLLRFVRLFLRWLFIWLDYLMRRARRQLQAAGRLFSFLLRPRNPNNLFVQGHEASHHASEVDGSAAGPEDIGGAERRSTLLWAYREENKAATQAVSLWRGTRTATTDDAQPGAAAANRRFAYLDLLAAQIKRLPAIEIAELDALIDRLTRKWLDIDQHFEHFQRRNRLDVGRTLRYNIPRYAGRILNFKWATKERPIPQLSKPAKILVIGDVSHSMVHYVSVVLYFFHQLNFRFVVDSYVFSEHATHATPYLNGVGTFEEKVHRLMAGARSWNAGTRFGSVLEEIADLAAVDEYTSVIVATDGKVSLQAEEVEKIDRYMRDLRSRAKQVIFLTPSSEFSGGARGEITTEKLGALRYGFVNIPVYAVGPPTWYGTLGSYADRLYLIKTVQDLIDMTEDLLLAASDSSSA